MSGRREFMEGVAVLASARWDEEPYDIEDAENWDPVETDHTTGQFTPSRIWTSCDGPIGGLQIRDELDDHDLDVWYDAGGVNVDFEGRSEEFRATAGCTFSPKEARELAAALYQAAEELDRRPGGP